MAAKFSAANLGIPVYGEPSFLNGPDFDLCLVLAGGEHLGTIFHHENLVAVVATDFEGVMPFQMFR